MTVAKTDPSTKFGELAAQVTVPVSRDTDDRPSIDELQKIRNECRCGGMFSRSHNPSRGCPRHGSLEHDVANRARLQDANPVLLEIASAALAWRGDGSPRKHDDATKVSARLLEAVSKVRS